MSNQLTKYLSLNLGICNCRHMSHSTQKVRTFAAALWAKFHLGLKCRTHRSLWYLDHLGRLSEVCLNLEIWLRMIFHLARLLSQDYFQQFGMKDRLLQFLHMLNNWTLKMRNRRSHFQHQLPMMPQSCSRRYYPNMGCMWWVCITLRIRVKYLKLLTHRSCMFLQHLWSIKLLHSYFICLSLMAKRCHRFRCSIDTRYDTHDHFRRHYHRMFRNCMLDLNHLNFCTLCLLHL